VDTKDRGGPVLARDSTDTPVGDTQVYARDLDKANAEADAIVRRNLSQTR
jgi:membrane fusion protein, multidrug efflux system